ncbi:hypothetical protein F7M78_24015, partial [Salmonella enterica subsp. enterica serovar Typhimurium]|nr:hypothetical protein [Salmonella enterica subsp. enterica serovar Typhimurium]
MNCLIKTLTALLPAIVVFPLSGCASRPDYTLAPSADAERVTVAVTLPPETEVLPLDVLYRSETCRKEVYDNTSASHVTTVRGVNPRLVALGQADSAGRREAKIAINGGGKCGWRLSAIRVDIQMKGDAPLAAGKHIIPTSYVFGFDDEAYGSGEGSGRKRVAHGDLTLKTELFPMTVIDHVFNENTLVMFGGDTDYEKWSRHYRLFNSKNILIEPVLYS